jgi:hypothetical protein
LFVYHKSSCVLWLLDPTKINSFIHTSSLLKITGPGIIYQAGGLAAGMRNKEPTTTKALLVYRFRSFKKMGTYSGGCRLLQTKPGSPGGIAKEPTAFKHAAKDTFSKSTRVPL